MFERKQFKTRLCMLYHKGRCNREMCNFAHGNAELRRSSSYNGRRDYLGNDLRDRLDRRHLSPPRYSPARNARGRQTIRDYSPSRSPEKKSDRRHRRKQGISGQSDISGSLKVSERINDQVKDGKLLSSGSRNTLEEQLKKLQFDMNTLENRKSQLVVQLDESVQEVYSLKSRIQELEAQLNKENEERKRLTSIIRNFVQMHNQNVELHDELMRAQVRLQRVGDQLFSDISINCANEEDLSVDIVSNGDNTAALSITKHNIEQNGGSPCTKRLHEEQDSVEDLKQDESKGGHLVETRSKKRSRWNFSAQLNDKGCEEVTDNGTEATNIHSEKVKESKIEVPPTSMAAHVFDEDVEIEHDNGTDINETAKTENENGVAFQVKAVPFMFSPDLIPRSNYSQYEGKDEIVDADGDDEVAAGAHVDKV